MNNKLLILSLASLASFPLGAREINVNPGELAERIILLKDNSDKVLTITGTATPIDLTYLRLLPSNVSELDLSQLKVKGCLASNGAWFGKDHFEDDEIPAYMLLGTNVSSLKLPASVSVIGAGAFSGTALKELDLTGVKGIGNGAFFGCHDLVKVSFSGSDFKEIPEYLFSGCSSLTEVKLPNTITSVEKHAFEKTGLKKVSLPNVIRIDDYAFAFAQSLTDISFASGCEMGEGVFYGTGSLENITGNPANISSLYSASGKYDSVLSVKTEEVGEGAFAGASASAIGIGKDVKKINRFAFRAMPNLKHIDVNNCEVISDVDATAFDGNDVSSITLYVSPGEAEKWRTAPVWGAFRISEDPSGVEDISSESGDMDIRYSDGMISVASSMPIEDFGLYGVDGAMIYSSNPAQTSVSVPFPDGYEIVIARASGKGGVRIKKIMK